MLAPQSFSATKPLKEAKRLENQAIRLYIASQYAEAVPLVKRSLAIRKQALGPAHLTVGDALSLLALLYRSQGHYKDAEPLFKRANAIYVTARGPDYEGVATNLKNLAVLYHAQGHHKKALTLYKRSLSIFEKNFKPRHPNIVELQNKMAELLKKLSKEKDATHIKRAKEPTTFNVRGTLSDAWQLNKKATHFLRAGYFKKAEPLYNRSLAISEKILGPYHPTVATILNNLAALHKKLGRHKKAEPLHSAK